MGRVSAIEDHEEWLRANTATCPIGRITRGQCESLRARPTPAQWIADPHKEKVHPNRACVDVRFRPSICADCRGWDYWTGERGKTMKDQESERSGLKRCSKCRQHKSVDQFTRKRSAPDGLQLQCRECQQVYWKRQKEKRRAERSAKPPGGAVLEPPEASQPSKAESVPAEKPKHGSLSLTIDFTDHRGLLDHIVSIAKTEDRTPEMQARYFLRCCLRRELGSEYEQGTD